MAENRLDREHTTREKDVRKRAWQRPETLPSPTPQDGYTHLWVRVSLKGWLMPLTCPPNYVKVGNPV